MSVLPATGRWDKDGQPIDVQKWLILYGNFGYRLVAQTRYKQTLVRTVWEGLDDGVGVAPMWATSAGASLEELRTVWVGFYPCTLAEALVRHEAVVARLRAEDPE